MRRNLDELGRIVLPADLRRDAGFAALQTVDLRRTASGILIQKAADCCLFCGGSGNLLELAPGRHLCQACAERAVAWLGKTL